MKDLVFLGDSRDRLRDFPEDARRTAGFQLRRVQQGLEPDNWKPMPTIGPGVREVRVREGGGAFRVIYVALVADAVHVLHAFQKKSQKTSRPDLDLAARRLRALTSKGSP
jgi:phage-related protein